MSYYCTVHNSPAKVKGAGIPTQCDKAGFLADPGRCNVVVVE